MDYVYTNGAIAVKEQQLLGEKLLRMSEMTVQDAFRLLVESGFGSGTDALSAHEFEKLVAADERDADEFIRAYAPSLAEKAYFLAERDFHNGKACVKAEHLRCEGELFAPDGLCPLENIQAAVKEEKYDLLKGELGEAVKTSVERLKNGASGAEIGMIFEREKYRCLAATCKGKLLKKLLAGRVDRINLLTAFRSSTQKEAEENYLEGGSLSVGKLNKAFASEDEAERELCAGELAPFVSACLKAKREGTPYTQAERMLDCFEGEFFAKRKYDLDRQQPFLYYVIRRRAQSANVRIVFVCLLAGMSEEEIKRRLRIV